MFKTKQFLTDHWGDPDGLAKFLSSYGRDVKKPMLAQWFHRERVPSEWAMTLLGLLEMERGAPVSLAKYVG